MRKPTLAAFCLTLIGFSTAAEEMKPHPFSVHDLLAMDRISDHRPSPRGDQVVFVLQRIDLAANRGRNDLWRVGVDGQGLTRLTDHEANDDSPRWSADGKAIYFLSARSGSSQVWRLPAAGGEATQVTDLPLDVGSFALSPDGSRLAVSLEVFPDCPTLACTKERLAAEEKSPATGQIFDRLFIRHWDTWKDGRRSHLFVVPAAGGGGEPVDVTRGMDADVPPKPFGGSEEHTFTPDGRGLVFTAREAGNAEPWSTDFDLYEVPADGSRKPRNLTDANPAWDAQPVFSPDGKTLAYLAMARPGYESDRFRVVLVSWPDAEARVLTEAWDRSPGELAFAPDGKTIYATAPEAGNVPLFAIDVASGKVRTLVATGSVHAPVPAGDRIVFGLDHLRAPVELHTLQPDGSGRKQITDVNREKLAAASMGEPEQMRFAGWNGEPVYAWVVQPAGFQSGKRYPVAFIIHGGPQGSSHDEFHYRWNPQAFAGAGYGVVMVDFHGSTGYGQAFTDAIRHDWGGKPLEDLQKGLAAALERYPWLDGERVCALGASYGGYMINWIAGNWPDRFRCLVNHDGIFDQRSMYYGTEELWFPEWEQGGPYHQSSENHEKHNPARFVDQWQTPMLVVHGGRDYRVPPLQGLATFTALQRRGVPSRLLWFPGENHWVVRPANSILWHETVLGWLDRWTEGKSGAAR